MPVSTPVFPIPPIIAGKPDDLCHHKAVRSGSLNTCFNISVKDKPDSEDEYYGQIIKALVNRRHETGWTQRELSETIGVNVNLVAKWEARIRRPSGFLLYCWADALDMRIKVIKKRYDQNGEEISD